MEMEEDKTMNATIEILGKTYPIRCLESEESSLQQAAQFLNEQMQAVQDSGKAINLERIAIITALNIANRYLQTDEQKSTLSSKINQRIAQLQDKIENALNRVVQTELDYSTE